MASVNNINLVVNAYEESNQSAYVECTINFSGNEVTANQRYRVRAYLYEEDAKRDFFVMKPDGRMRRRSEGNRDDFVGHISSGWVQPDGRDHVRITFRREWSFPDPVPLPGQKYFVTVSVIPELAMGDWEFSDVVDGNR